MCYWDPKWGSIPEREKLILLCYLLLTVLSGGLLPAWKPLVIASCDLGNICAQVKVPPPCVPKVASLQGDRAMPIAV